MNKLNKEIKTKVKMKIILKLNSTLFDTFQRYTNDAMLKDSNNEIRKEEA